MSRRGPTLIATPTAPLLARMPRPLFGGYVFVASVAAWLAGVALAPVGPLGAVPTGVWLALAAACAALWLCGRIATRRIVRAGRPGWRLLIAVAVLGCWFALGAGRAALGSGDSATVAHYATGGQVTVRGTVAAEPDLRAGYRFLTVSVAQISADGGHSYAAASGRIEATVYGPDDWFAPAYGDTVSLTGRLRPPGQGYSGPGIVARLTGARASVRQRGGGNTLLAALFRLRLRLAQAIQRALPEPEASLLIGILLGLKTPVLRARIGLFTATGTIHLVVPAGLKVATLAALATYGVRRLGVWPRTIAALLAVSVYAAVGGGGPAAVRAAIMGALLALSGAFARGYNVYTGLALAALVMTALDPLVVYDAGFQLTTLATFGLPLLVPPIQRRLARALGRLPASGAIAELLAVTLAAQIATLPVLALTFHQLSLIAPIANLLTVPLLAPVLLIGVPLVVCGALGSAVGGAAALALGWIAWPLLWFMNAVIAFCAGLPLAALSASNLPSAVAWLYYAILIAALWWRWSPLRVRLRGVRWRSPAAVAASSGGAFGVAAHAGGPGHAHVSRGLLVAILALALLGATGAVAPALARGNMAQLTFLDVGVGGEAILLRLPSGFTALIDGGPNGPALESELAGRIPFWRRALDLAVLTDPRAGDARGLEDAAGHFAVAQGIDAGMEHPTTEYIAWLDALARSGGRHTVTRQDQTVTLTPDTTLRPLSPPQALFPTSGGSTTASDDLILRLQTPGLRALLLGSADGYALDALAYSGEPLDADVVEVALPANVPLSLDGPLGAVLRLARPKLIIVSATPEAPTSAAARVAITQDPWATDTDAAQALGATILRTATAGSITLSGGASGWGAG